MSDIPDWPVGKWNTWIFREGEWEKTYESVSSYERIVKTRVVVINGKEHSWTMYGTHSGYMAYRKVRRLDPLEALGRLELE